MAGMVTFGAGANAFNMDFVAIGNAGNADDTTGNPGVAGKVEYEYQIGKHEVSEDMITEYNTNFGTANSLAITKDTRGTDKPATSVSWNEAARFVNWLNTSQGYQAAYYNPLTSTYSDYANGSNTAPTAVASGTAANTAVHFQTPAQSPADIMSAGGLSPYEIMGHGGNAWEWDETAANLNNSSGSSARGIRGGGWGSNSNLLSSSIRNNFNPAGESFLVGFRVTSLSSSASSVSEPGSCVLWTLIGVSTFVYRRRMRK